MLENEQAQQRRYPYPRRDNRRPRLSRAADLVAAEVVNTAQHSGTLTAQAYAWFPGCIPLLTPGIQAGVVSVKNKR
jgi:hypothetical protein